MPPACSNIDGILGSDVQEGLSFFGTGHPGAHVTCCWWMIKHHQTAAGRTQQPNNSTTTTKLNIGPPIWLLLQPPYLSLLYHQRSQYEIGLLERKDSWGSHLGDNDAG